MMPTTRTLCFAAISLFAQFVLAADIGDRGRAGTQADAVSTASDNAPGRAAGKGRPFDRSKRTAPKKTQTSGLRSSLDRGNEPAHGYLSLGPLGLRLFPLAILMQGQRVFEMFRPAERAALPAKLFCAVLS